MLGIGKNSIIKGAIIESNVSIGRDVTITNRDVPHTPPSPPPPPFYRFYLPQLPCAHVRSEPMFL